MGLYYTEKSIYNEYQVMDMNDQLKDLYRIPPQSLPQDIYLMDMAEECAHMEERVKEMMQRLSASDRELLKSYLDIRDELEFQSVKIALRFSKYVK